MLMNLENIMLSKEKPNTKGLILYDSIYRKYPEQASTQRQKIDWQLIGVGVSGGWE